jgi:hypothetical protein
VNEVPARRVFARGVALKRRASVVILNSDVPAAVFLPASARVEVMDVAGVMIGIDPHKGSHTAGGSPSIALP